MASLRVSLPVKIQQHLAMGYSDHHIGQVLGCSLAAVLAQREYLERVIREADPQIGHCRGGPKREEQHGTVAGHAQHDRDRTEPCPPCAGANRRRLAARNRKSEVA